MLRDMTFQAAEFFDSIVIVCGAILVAYLIERLFRFLPSFDDVQRADTQPAARAYPIQQIEDVAANPADWPLLLMLIRSEQVPPARLVALTTAYPDFAAWMEQQAR